jgi:hypothetical protein
MEQVLFSKWSAGAEYWQNRADYQLTAKLDENNEISQELLHTQITVLIKWFDELRSKFI